MYGIFQTFQNPPIPPGMEKNKNNTNFYVLESCALTFNETKQPREVTIPADGEENCINLEKIEGWTGCQGHCNSEVLYTNGIHKNSFIVNIQIIFQNIFTFLGEFVSDCHCCQAADFESREIPVICSRGNIKTAVLRFPSKCQCLLCGSPLDGASNIIETPHLTEDREVNIQKLF